MIKIGAEALVLVIYEFGNILRAENESLNPLKVWIRNWNLQRDCILNEKNYLKGICLPAQRNKNI